MRFSDVIGQADLKERLKEAVLKDRVAHAQLFVGGRGSGNLPLALAYIRYVLCTDRTVDDACGTCTSCLGMEKLEHPDVHFSFPIRLEKNTKTCHHYVVDWRERVLDNPYLDLDEWTNHHAVNKNVLMGVDEVAAINSKLSLRSYSGGYKVVCVWYPERMNTQGANKLLKAIEEPPERTLFILVAENSEALLPTIISRTQRVRVPMVDHSSLAAFVQSAYDVQWETALDVAMRSEGDVLEAHHVASTEENALLPIFRNWMLSCYYRKADDTKDVCDSFHALGREGQKRFIRYGLQKIRQCVLFDQGLSSLVHAVDEEKMFLQKFSRFIDLNTAEWFREEFDRMHRHLDRNASGKVMFMDTSFQLYQRLNR